MNVIECSGMTKKYGRKTALNNITFSIEENKITGLIGRNGAGKTTLLKIIAGFLRETSGEVNVFSERPFNNLKVSANMVVIDDNMNFQASLTLSDLLKAAGSFYRNWDEELANRLFHYFSFSPKQRHANLSKGMKSTFNMIVGLSARCSLTIFDEPTTGMDAAVRKDFYRALLKDYIEHPRTILLSSHHLNEIEDLLEDVLLIKDGEKRLHRSITDLKEYGIGVSGKTEIIQDWIKEKEILHQKTIGKGSSYVVVKKDIPESTIQQARLVGLEVTSISSEDVCVYLTSKEKGEIDDVFNRG